jgi:hypothetical protein
VSDGYAMLFSSITMSSIWAEDDQTRIVFITMLAMADADGYVGASIPGIAHVARVPVEAVESAIQKFLNPDPYSRSQHLEGRRLTIADRGWTLVNYHRFRGNRDPESRREQNKLNKRAQREREKKARDVIGLTDDKADGHPISAQAEAEAYIGGAPSALTPPPPDPKSRFGKFKRTLFVSWQRLYEGQRGQFTGDDGKLDELALALWKQAERDAIDPDTYADAALRLYWADEWVRLPTSRPSLRNFYSQLDRIIAAIREEWSDYVRPAAGGEL